MNIGQGLAVLLCAVVATGCAVAVEPRGTKTDPPPTRQSTKSQTTSGTAGSPSQAAERTVVLPDKAGGLNRVQGQGQISDVPVDPGQMGQGMNLVVAEFVTPGGSVDEAVLVVAVDHVPEDTSKRREHLWRGLIDRVGYTEGVSAEPFPPGPLGGSLECFLASLAETGQVICGWADAGTAGVALFPNSDLPTAARTFAAMRADIER
ncbi:hypothetical protein [Actinocorallia sp. A-T 12471]|uniref:hypothetical protein n=1 Tax=Actinocorallia sp. A-T 12471 TaxID=3089813 RepID=UPI0029D2BF02|nr:hypothetical protein [Actinocorallia sp. A-T 12471]MDX6742450.1 hypothetical protein [Actinocorallia sp. A-T 12471]